jgi:hypothetical protein
MGAARRLAERADLAAMTPHNELSSTKYCLAQPGVEYIVYLPEGGMVIVDLSNPGGWFNVEWIDPIEGQSKAGEAAAGGGKRMFQAPDKGAAVLYLKKQ